MPDLAAARRPLLSRAALALTAVPLLALSACTASAVPDPAESSSAAAAAPCATPAEVVTVVVDFGPLDAPAIEACAPAGSALDALAAAQVTTEGTADYGDQIVCRVNGRPAADETVEIPGAEPFVEECASMPSASAYWALWVRSAPDAEWEYAQEGVATLQLAAGESLGLVYTAGTDSAPPAE